MSEQTERQASVNYAAMMFILGGCVIVLFFLRSLVAAFQTQSIDDFLRDLKQSAWAKATLLDYVVGALFTGSWIAMRQTERVLGLPHVVWALLLPPLGNPVLYAYVLLSVWRERNVAHAIVPLRRNTNTVSLPEDERTLQVRQQAWAFAVAFLVIGTAYFALLMYAFVREDIFEAVRKFMWNGSLLRATFNDVQCSILFCSLLIVLREGLLDGRCLSTFAWVAALVLLGHGTACLYAVSVARDALTWNVSIGEAFATSKSSCSSQYI
jgi:hypothetical protein